MDAERWRPVVGFEGFYEVSDAGRVRSLPRRVQRGFADVVTAGRVLTLQQQQSGHLICFLYVEGVGHKRFIHRLVLEAFVGPAPDEMQGCHENDLPHDNRLSNLRWDTRKANAQDAIRNGRNKELRKTECVNGHSFSPENTKIRASGARTCIACSRANRKKRYQWLAEQRTGGAS